MNSFISYRINEKNKRRSVVLDEFRTSVRDPVRETLQGLNDICGQVKIVAKNSPTGTELRARLGPINKELVSKLGEISDALADANQSTFANGKDWLDGFSDAEDEILALFDKALNVSRTEDEMRDAVAFIPVSIRRLRSKILTRIEAEVKRLS
ncbi:hypothetical protein [Hyphococcus sp. DH-69]|uniref:hypothetical protein n=1 Tax=Hyphococcus formosus TaxID=3143534 RepID=UPI00398BBBE6